MPAKSILHFESEVDLLKKAGIDCDVPDTGGVGWQGHSVTRQTITGLGSAAVSEFCFRPFAAPHKTS